MNAADAEQETLEVSRTQCALNLLKDVPGIPINPDLLIKLTTPVA